MSRRNITKEEFNSLTFPLSDKDIHDAFLSFKDRANIKEDKNITPDTNINDLFDNRGHVVIFHKYPNQKVGHWYALLRDKKGNVFFADSLRHRPEYYNKHYMQFFKNNGIKKVIINEDKWQDGNTSVCGRYAIILPVLNKLYKGINLDGIYKFFGNGKKKYGTTDKFVLHLTS